MSNGIFTAAKTALLQGNINWVSNDIRAVLIDTGLWTPNFATDDNLNDVPGGARTATSGSLASKTVSAGAADAADVTFASVSGNQSEGILVYKHTGNEATSTLLVFWDTAVTGLPVTPNGDDITVRWNAAGVLAFS